jgi:DNA-binding response OmpR family regulator
MTDAAAAPAAAKTVLVVEDDPTLAATLSYNLRKQGFRVVSAGDGAAALAAARDERPDLVVLDLMLPKVDGLEVCRRLRSQSDVPVLMLTAKTAEMDKVVGLEVGADDYVTKPFSMRELVARIRALLRRAGAQPRGEVDAPLVVGPIEVDLRGHVVRRGGEVVALKPKEFDLLAFLARNPGQVFTREQLLQHVWGYDFFGGSRTVDVHMRWLREKLEERPSAPCHLLTVRGVGYKLVR